MAKDDILKDMEMPTERPPINDINKFFSEVDGNDAEVLDPFDAPIPGQSLTDEPGSRAWETPPEFSDIEEAYMAMEKKLHTDKAVQEKLIRLMYSGVPVIVLVKAITMGGFQEGLWTPDMAELLNIPLTFLLTQLAIDAGIKPKLEHKGAVAEKGKEMPSLLSMQAQFNPKEYKQLMREVPQMKGVTEELTESVPEAIGFMSPEGEE